MLALSLWAILPSYVRMHGPLSLPVRSDRTRCRFMIAPTTTLRYGEPCDRCPARGDTERPDGRAIEVAAKARWEAACAHHRAGGKEHPTWDEFGTGDWAPYPKDLLLVEAFLSVWGTEQEQGR